MNVIELQSIDGAVWAREAVRSGGFPVRVPGARVKAAGRAAARKKEPPKPGSFAERVEQKRVDLIGLIENGAPELEYLPASDGMLIRGRKHLISAPKREGKSIAMLVHYVDMALAGGRVIVFDRENGGTLYALRLEEIIASRELTDEDVELLRANVAYYEFPRLKREDRDDLIRLAKGVDLVVFDSQRLFLQDWGLKENDSDDYAEFIVHAVDPLFHAEVATVILDNTGHEEKDRARGTSAKGDLNECLFTLAAERTFSKDRPGRVRLKLAPGASRFGNEGEWVMDIGAGAFSPWQRVGDTKREIPVKFRETVRTLLPGIGSGLSQTQLFAVLREEGVRFNNEQARNWLYQMVASEEIAMISPNGKGTACRYLKVREP